MKNELVFSTFSGSKSDARKIQKLFDRFNFGFYLPLNLEPRHPGFNVLGSSLHESYLEFINPRERYFIDHGSIDGVNQPLNLEKNDSRESHCLENSNGGYAQLTLLEDEDTFYGKASIDFVVPYPHKNFCLATLLPRFPIHTNFEKFMLRGNGAA